jgi:uncharacterized protein YjbI with pentapeptide repeats
MSVQVPRTTIAIAIGVAVFIIVIAAIALVVSIPSMQANMAGYYPGSPEYFEAVDKARSTFVKALTGSLQGLGGIGLSITAYVALRNLEVNKQVAEDNRKLTEDKQVSERFVEAVKMLADKDRLEVRLGGIYALERVSKDSERDHWTVMEVLISFIQMKFPVESKKEKEGKKVSKDLQAALTVIGRRDASKDPARKVLDLARTDLSGTDLSGANLSKAGLSDADLSGANLSKAGLSNADLSNADLSNADLSNADLSGVVGIGAILSKANLNGANLSGVDLIGAKLSRANLSEANLIRANLYAADLKLANLEMLTLLEADLSEANLTWANLKETDLNSANLSRANLSGSAFS